VNTPNATQAANAASGIPINRGQDLRLDEPSESIASTSTVDIALTFDQDGSSRPPASMPGGPIRFQKPPGPMRPVEPGRTSGLPRVMGKPLPAEQA